HDCKLERSLITKYLHFIHGIMIIARIGEFSKDSIKSYFDLGCGNGLITAQIGKYFNLSKENIFGGDVFNSNNPQITFVSIDENQSTIDLGDQSVHLITCLVTLHHIPNIEKF
ncbi:unnamed protein product, partial [Adineta steineri]